jgi:translation initiation factor 2 gamma subunit (eIF-2gamma)
MINKISRGEYGIHHMIIYPNLVTLREFYSRYTKKQIEENNESIQIMSFYETITSIRQALSEDHCITGVSGYEKGNISVIMDSLKYYFSQQKEYNHVKSFKMMVKSAKNLGKNGISILCDLGTFHYKDKKRN